MIKRLIYIQIIFLEIYLFIGDHTGPNGVKLTWKSTEHYFQVYKFLHSNADVSALYMDRHLPSTLVKAHVIWDLNGQTKESAGNNIDINYWHKSRRGCEPGKLRAMYNAIKMKFTQNDDLKQHLINTGNAILVENAGGSDKYWGHGPFKIRRGGSHWDLINIGGNASEGQNRLGLLLMQIRDEFTGQTTCPA